MAAVPRISGLFTASPPDAAAGEGMMAQIARMAEAAGAPVPRLMADFAALSLGPGRIGLSDYASLRLYDEAFWGDGDRREVVGAGRGRALARLANFRRDCFGLASDRLACGAYLAAHGLPTVLVLAVFRAGLAAPGRTLLRTGEELRQFLAAEAHRPLVVRPAEGGRPRFLFADPGRDPGADIDRLVDEARDTPGVSWLIQPRLSPHPAAARQTGGALLPVRLLTLAGERGAKAWRAIWRLGGREDLVASLDLKTGQARSVFQAAEPERVRPSPVDLAVPDWPALKATATEGARLFSQFGFLGWDVAAAQGGPVILGVDPTPDVALCQLADRRGLLAQEFLAFLAERRALAAAWRRPGG